MPCTLRPSRVLCTLGSSSLTLGRGEEGELSDAAAAASSPSALSAEPGVSNGDPSCA